MNPQWILVVQGISTCDIMNQNVTKFYHKWW